MMNLKANRWWFLASVLQISFSIINGKALKGSPRSLQSWNNLTPDNRTLCPETPETLPPNRVSTTDRIAALRQAMADITLTGGQPLDAYMVLLSDEHGTSGISDYDQRVRYMTGFSGSNGYALVTNSQAALWTDGRYFTQADMEMDCNWILMKEGQPGYPTGEEWLTSFLSEGSRTGAYGKYVSIDTWNSYSSALLQKNISIIDMEKDLVDVIWTTNRPARPNNPIFIHNLTFAGVDWATKVAQMRQLLLTDQSADALVVTVLEEVAWLFNLRGTDKTFSLFYAYAILETNNISLFLENSSSLISSEDIQSHLGINSLGRCNSPPNCVNVYEYSTILDHVTNLSTSGSIIWLDPTTNYAIYSKVSPDNRIVTMSPIALPKSIKNPTESLHFFDCIKRDSAALVEFLAFLEKEMEIGNNWTEISAATKLQGIRSEYPYYKGISFDTISAAGPNGAIIHYMPVPETDAKITTNELYLLDSGGQYLDGTTDVTRTMHYGTPTTQEKEAYTRVLMGAIDLAMTIWPEGLYGSEIDAISRAPLWKNGWDYNHGTGHGIGYYLSVHEGPATISMGKYGSNYRPLYEGMFFSDEPGYYEDGKYGVRLETLVGIVKANTSNSFGGKKFIGFIPATLVPFEPKLINVELLMPNQINWLDSYNQRCLNEVGSYVLNIRGNQQAYDWIVARTQPIAPTTSRGVCMQQAYFVYYIIMIYICTSTLVSFA